MRPGESHAGLAAALARLLAAPDGKAVLSLADKRVGLPQFVEAAASHGLSVTVLPASEAMLSAARTETGVEDLCSTRGHSLYFIERLPKANG